MKIGSILGTLILVIIGVVIGQFVYALILAYTMNREANA